MKNVVIASLLAVAGVALVAQPSFGQAPASPAGTTPTAAPVNFGDPGLKKTPPPANVSLGTAAPAQASAPTSVSLGAGPGKQAAAPTAVSMGGFGAKQTAGVPGADPALTPCGSGAGKSGLPAPVSLGGGAGGGQVQMSADEYALYNNAVTATDKKAQAAAFEAYLTAYPKSAVKSTALQQLMFAYSAVPDTVKTQDAADRLLDVDPCNIYAYVFEVGLREGAAASATDPAVKQAGYDSAADFARKGLTVTKTKDVPPGDFDTLKNSPQGFAAFYSAIATDYLQKKDNADAIKGFKQELNFVPVATTTAPGQQLQDTYYLASAYYTSTPPDFLNCSYYASRAMTYAPEPYKTQFKQLAQYCYRKFHGADDGFDDMVTIAAANLNPPATFSVKPAPTPADIVSNLIATTPDLSVLALSDREYVLQNGKPEDAAKVFDTVKGKAVTIPDAVVVAATADSVQIAVSDDSQHATPPTADFTVNFATPLTKVPAVGDKITVQGTYASYTQSPLMITMSDGAIQEPEKAPVKKTPVHHTPVKH